MGTTAGTGARAARWHVQTKLAACAAVLGALVVCGAAMPAPAGASTGPQATSTTAASAGSALATLPASFQSYWLASANGAVTAFGGAPLYGTASGTPLDQPVVGITATSTAGGYWLVASDGGVFSFGNARYQGSMGGQRLYRPVVGMAEAPATGGYWLVASDGGIFSFDAPFYGSMGNHPLDEPVVGMAAMPTGGGYWLVAADGGIFTFGKPNKFYGSTGGERLDQPIVGMSAAATGNGYLLVAADGGIFTFGSAATMFYGSLGGHSLAYPIAGMAAMFSDKGYWLTDTHGGVSPFGTAKFFGDLPAPQPVVGIAPAKGNGDPPPAQYTPGSYGYDVSGYQCSNLPSGAHTIGVVEVDGWGAAAPNPCFVTEVSWANPGVNLYMFTIYGTSTTAEPGCASAPVPTACNFGYSEAATDFQTAQADLNARATVPWWLDLEQANWSGSTVANQSVVMGALDALHGVGVSTVGFYFSLFGWGQLFGTYNPPGPLFPAWWTGPTPAYKCAHARTLAASTGHFMPSGPIELIQYSDNVHGYDGDYAC